MKDGAGDGEAAKLLEGFVEEIASIKIGGNEDVGMAGDGGIRGFFLADYRIHGGVKLHLSVDENTLLAEIGNDFFG